MVIKCKKINHKWVILAIVPEYATMEESLNKPEISFSKLVQNIKI